MVTTIGHIVSPDQELFLKMWRTNVDPAMRLVQDHRHVNFEIAMVTSGSGTYVTAAGSLPILPGDVFVFPSNEAHWIQQIHAQGLEIVNLHFNQVFYHSACAVSLRYPNLFFAHSKSFPTRIPAEDAGQLRQILDRIKGELEESTDEYDMVVSSLINLLFCQLMRHHNYYLPKEGIHTAIGRIAPSLRYIDEAYCQTITLEQIAEKSGLSSNYFCKVFKDCFNLKLWDYVVSKRIDKAKQLLRIDGQMNILDIALQCGFNNTANFNRAFLRFTGLTPKEYKRGSPLH